MKTLRFLICWFIIPASLSISAAAPSTAPVVDSTIAELDVVLSPWTDRAQRKQQAELVRTFLLKTAPVHLEVRLLDGWTLDRLASGKVPKLVYDNPAARSQSKELGPTITALRSWGEAAPPSSADFAGSQAIRAPEVLHKISADPAAGERAIVVIGSPLYRHPTDAAYSMVEGRYPSDGHLGCTLNNSIYGTAQKRERLKHTTVHWVIPSALGWLNSEQEQATTRFWTLFVQSQSGTLATFNGDLPVALERARSSNHEPVLSVQIDPTQQKPLMRTSGLATLAPEWLTQPPIPVVLREPAAPPSEPPAPVRTPAVTPPVESPAPAPAANSPVAMTPPTPAVQPTPMVVSTPPVAIVPPIQLPSNFDRSKTAIGIAWPADIDLDLHVRADPKAAELYYGRDRTADGRLYKDERHATTGRYFEFVEFIKPVDLNQVRVWVHYYGGRAADVTGQVVLFDRGQIRVGTFTLAASRGNGNDLGEQRHASPHWVEVRLSDLAETGTPLAAAKPVGAR